MSHGVIHFRFVCLFCFVFCFFFKDGLYIQGGLVTGTEKVLETKYFLHLLVLIKLQNVIVGDSKRLIT